MGPALGPVIGGFLGEAAGWRWVMGFMAAFSGFAWFLGSFFVPETYAPYLLRKRAARLSKITGKLYRSKLDIDRGSVSLSEALKTAMTRPWVLLFREPIVIILSLYMAVVYGTLYMLFAAYPIVYTKSRHWSTGVGGLSFIGVLIGMLLAVTYYIAVDNPRYQKVADQHKGNAPPEARLPPSLIGAVLLPVGLFWFAWTNSPSIHWAVSMAAGIPFGGGMVFIFLSIMNYLIDSYTIFAASVLAANSVLRSCFGAAFPLFTSDMYANLGIHWASSVPAFLALALAPFPFLFYKYGRSVRLKCKYAAESAAFIERMNAPSDDHEEEHTDTENSEKAAEKENGGFEQDGVSGRRSSDDQLGPRFERIKTGASSRSRKAEWDDNPYVIDRVNTRESFGSGMARTKSFGSGLGRTKSYGSNKAGRA
jgi:MFS family permease